MKNYLYIILFMLPLVSCVNKQKADQLSSQKDSLAVILAQKDSAFNEVLVSLSTVASNLNTIKMRENIITQTMEGGEIPKSATTQINEDIEAINQLLIENRQTISRLEQTAAQFKKANLKIASLEKLIAQMTSQIEAKDQEIKVLKHNLENMNVKVTELNQEVTGLNTKVSSLTTEKSSLQGEVKAQSDLLNTGYYIVGREKELLAKEIVYKSGFIGRTLKINENRSLDSFTQIDIRNFDVVSIGHKKASLVSSHPSGSYEFKMNSDEVFESLVIKDKAKFWEYSKVLVISYK